MDPNIPADFQQKMLDLQAQGQGSDALQQTRTLLQHHPENIDLQQVFGYLLHLSGQSRDALPYMQRVAGHLPDSAQAFCNLAEVLRGCHEHAQAVEAYQQAIKLDRMLISAWNGGAHSLQALERWDEAERAYRRSLQLDPHNGDQWTRLGLLYRQLGQYEEAETCLRACLSREGDHDSARFGLALVLLSMGRYEEGFDLYESRFSRPENSAQQLSKPRWNGEILPESTLFLHAEQGYGDTIQFIRFARLAAERVKHLVVEVQNALLPLLNGMEGVDRFVTRNDQFQAYDVHLPLMSLPHVLKLQETDFAMQQSYLKVPQRRLKTLPKDRPNIALVWAGDPRHNNDHNRSLSPELFKPLLNNSEMNFFSLQIGKRAWDLGKYNLGGEIEDFSAHIQDFGDTAVLLKEMDLLISVDTATAHLAGALAIPVWMLLPFSPDWRWLTKRHNSPWYPGLRLFRQTSPGDWTGAIDQLRQALRQDFATHCQMDDPKSDSNQK